MCKFKSPGIKANDDYHYRGGESPKVGDMVEVVGYNGDNPSIMLYYGMQLRVETVGRSIDPFLTISLNGIELRINGYYPRRFKLIRRG